MGRGKAQGADRDYQVLARDIVQIISREEGLVPYEGDGVDVPFEMGGSTWTLDIALKKPDDSKIVVGECRRWASPIEQEHVAAFAYKVELLRESTGKEVAGFYFTKQHFRVGAVKAAAKPGIKVITCKQDQLPSRFFLTYHTYDQNRKKRIRKHLDYAEISLPDEPDEYDPTRSAFQ